MAYPEKPTGNSSIGETDFANKDNQIIPMDDDLFNNGYKNADENELDSVPNAHESNWLFNMFHKNIRYCIGMSEENKSVIDKQSTEIKNINSNLKLKANQTEVDSLKTTVNTKTNKNLSDSTPAQSFIDKTVGWIIPNYKGGIAISSGYTTPKAGVVVWNPEVYNSSISNGATYYLSVNGINVLSCMYRWSTYNKYMNNFTPSTAVGKGSVITFTRGSVVFYPCQ